MVPAPTRPWWRATASGCDSIDPEGSGPDVRGDHVGAGARPAARSVAAVLMRQRSNPDEVTTGLKPGGGGPR